jgi:hypothetical protein
MITMHRYAPHFWDRDEVFCYQPTTSFETADVLDLLPGCTNARFREVCHYCLTTTWSDEPSRKGGTLY